MLKNLNFEGIYELFTIDDWHDTGQSVDTIL
jgi:hypothetical protein